MYFNPTITSASLIAAAAAMALSSTAQAQVWSVTQGEVAYNGYAEADDHLVPLGGPPTIDIVQCIFPAATPLDPAVMGWDLGKACIIRAVEKKSSIPQSVVDAEAYAVALVNGVNTNTITAKWVANTSAESAAVDGYHAFASLNYAYDLAVQITGGGPIGTPVTVFVEYSAFGHAWTKHEEAVPEDPAATRNVTLSIDGTEQLLGAFNFGGPLLIGFNEIPSAGFSFQSAVGNTHTINITADMDSNIDMRGRGLYEMQDTASTLAHGEITLSINVPIPPGPTPTQPGIPEFSVDIGSDTETSDANLDGNPTFDPGDCYPWYGPLLPPCGADGIKDDTVIFAGVDWFPDAPSCFGPATGAPPCSGIPADDLALISQWFDLDGHDNAGFDITNFAFGNPGDRIAQFNDPCVHTPQYLYLSYDDDTADHYAHGGPCSVPVFSPSPMASTTYGTSSGADEVFQLDTSASAPATVFATLPFLDETTLHPNLFPNPDLGDNEDDDVDSLDIPFSAADCQFWYFSADHEAPGVDPTTGLTFDPGAIYLVTPLGAVVKVIDESHLGITGDTDVDAFEFVWLAEPGSPGPHSLAVLFSVDDDDPATFFTDESGGLDPAMLYASFLDGTSFDYLAAPLSDDIDAITAWSQSLSTLPPAPCDGDANGDRVVDVNDISYVLFRLGTPGPDGDVNADGTVDVNDISYVLFRLGTVCP